MGLHAGPQRDGRQQQTGPPFPPPPGGGKNDIPNRLKRQFGLFNVPLPSVAAINAIFGRLVEGRFARGAVADEVASVAARLVPMTVALWNRTQAKMLPTPAKFHYLFNMRELSKVFQGVVLASRDRCARGARPPPALVLLPSAVGSWRRPPAQLQGPVAPGTTSKAPPSPHVQRSRFNKAAPRAGFGGCVTTPDGYLLGLWLHECRCEAAGLAHGMSAGRGPGRAGDRQWKGSSACAP